MDGSEMMCTGSGVPDPVSNGVSSNSSKKEMVKGAIQSASAFLGSIEKANGGVDYSDPNVSKAAKAAQAAMRASTLMSNIDNARANKRGEAADGNSKLGKAAQAAMTASSIFSKIEVSRSEQRVQQDSLPGIQESRSGMIGSSAFGSEYRPREISDLESTAVPAISEEMGTWSPDNVGFSERDNGDVTEEQKQNVTESMCFAASLMDEEPSEIKFEGEAKAESEGPVVFTDSQIPTEQVNRAGYIPVETSDPIESKFPALRESCDLEGIDESTEPSDISVVKTIDLEQMQEEPRFIDADFREIEDEEPEESVQAEVSTVQPQINAVNLGIKIPFFHLNVLKSVADKAKFSNIKSSFEKGTLVQALDEQKRPFLWLYQLGTELMAYKYIGSSLDIRIPATVGKRPVRYLHPDLLTVSANPIRTVKNQIKNNIDGISVEGVRRSMGGAKSLVLPEGIVSIPPEFFKGCKNLKEVVIPSTVISISCSAFSDSNLEKVYFNGACPSGFRSNEYIPRTTKICFKPEFANTFINREVS